MKDFFISYNKSDGEWAKWIAWQLEANGYSTIIQEWDFLAGSNFVLNMQNATSKVKSIIAILSPDYLSSQFTKSEWASAFCKDPTGEEGILLPVRVKSCRLEGLLPQIIYIDLVGKNKEQAKKILLDEVKRRRRKPSSEPEFPSPEPELPSPDVGKTPGTENSNGFDLNKSLKNYVQGILNWQRLRDLDRFHLKLYTKHRSDTYLLNDLLEDCPRLVITGAPGSGKSIFLLRLLKKHCLSLKETIETCPKNKNQAEVPVYFELGALTQAGSYSSYNDHTQKSLLSLINNQLFPFSKKETINDLFKVIDEYRVIFLIDGLNEIPKDYREKCTRELFDLDHKLRIAGKQENLKIVLTSRIYGFENRFESEGWNIAEILPLKPEAIEEELANSLKSETLQSQDLFWKIDPKLRQMLSNPQHLDLFIEWCEGKKREGSSIEGEIWSKGELLKYCVEKRLNRLDENRKSIIESILTQIAYRNTSAGTFFSYYNISRITKEVIQSCGSKIEPELLLIEMFNLGILVRFKDCIEIAPSPKKLNSPCQEFFADYACRFVHHSIQQYFTACYMKRNWEVDKYVKVELWHEPMVIMAGILEYERLIILLDKIYGNKCLYAYVLANVHAPELERDFLDKTINGFTKLVGKYASQLSWSLSFIAMAWFLSIPFLVFLFCIDQSLHYSSVMKAVLISLGCGYFFFVPPLLIRWHNSLFRNMKERIVDHELPNIIIILRYLLARGAMEKIRNELNKLYNRIKCHEEDPRRAFIKETIETVGQAVDVSSYMTEDEMLEQLCDPLISAAIDVKAISSNGVAKLICVAKNPEDDQAGFAAMDFLKEWYLVVPEYSADVKQLFIAIGIDTKGIYSRARHRRAIKICREIGINLPQQRSWIWRYLFSFLSFLNVFDRK